MNEHLLGGFSPNLCTCTKNSQELSSRIRYNYTEKNYSLCERHDVGAASNDTHLQLISSPLFSSVSIRRPGHQNHAAAVAASGFASGDEIELDGSASQTLLHEGHDQPAPNRRGPRFQQTRDALPLRVKHSFHTSHHTTVNHMKPPPPPPPPSPPPPPPPLTRLLSIHLSLSPPTHGCGCNMNHAQVSHSILNSSENRKKTS